MEDQNLIGSENPFGKSSNTSSSFLFLSFWPLFNLQINFSKPSKSEWKIKPS